MAVRQIYKALQKELSIINAKAFKTHSEKEIAHSKTRLQYEKIQLAKQRKSTKHIEEQIAQLDKGETKSPRVNSSIAKEIIYEKEPSKMNLAHMSNITLFLRSQREYTELVERYNPGLGMEQEDRVKRTANRVGLQLPEN